MFLLNNACYELSMQEGFALHKIAHGTVRNDDKGRTWFFNGPTKRWRLQKLKDGAKTKKNQVAGLEVLETAEGDIRTYHGIPHQFRSGAWESLQEGDSVRIGDTVHRYEDGMFATEAEHDKRKGRIAKQKARGEKQKSKASKPKAKDEALTLRPKQKNEPKQLTFNELKKRGWSSNMVCQFFGCSRAKVKSRKFDINQVELIEDSEAFKNFVARKSVGTAIAPKAKREEKEDQDAFNQFSFKVLSDGLYGDLPNPKAVLKAYRSAAEKDGVRLSQVRWNHPLILEAVVSQRVKQ